VTRLWRLLAFVALVIAALAIVPCAARAQMMGDNLKGDYGLQSGTQAPPGWLVGLMYSHYATDEVKDRDGNSLPFGGESISDNSVSPFVQWTSEFHFLGGNYGFAIGPGLVDQVFDSPAIGVENDMGWGIGDTYVQPVVLGWTKPHADHLAGLGLFVPTGRYTKNGSNNTGLGMWGYEIFGGTTWYPDSARVWNLAATAFLEAHSKKQDSNARVGALLTIEGGAGHSFVYGAVNAGLAYYAQWKLTDDDLDLATPLTVSVGRNHVYAIGPEVNAPLVYRNKFLAVVNLRYLIEFGARSATQGHSFFLTFTFPLALVGQRV
jgi:hypothetical protein